MKYNIIKLFIGLLLFSSCSKEFLQKTDPTRVVADGFYKDGPQLVQALDGVYSKFQPLILEQWTFAELPSDNTTIDFDPGNRFYHDRMEQNEYWTVNSINPQITTMFNNHYSLIANANTTLGNIEGATAPDAVKNEVKGQLLFLRALAYFYLVQYFDGVPLVVQPISSPAESYAYKRESAQNVWAQIEKDLTDAAGLLPPSYNAANKGRATKGAALSLLGKTYLTQKKYPDAVSTLQQVLPLGYDLLDNYADVFDPANKNHVESIFDIQFQGDNTLGEHSDFSYTFAPRLSKGYVTGYTSGTNRGWNTPTNDIIAAYEPSDARKDVSLQEGYIGDGGAFIPIPYISKYNHPHTIAGRTNDNWPVLRYADVLLMLAEAINEAGSGPTSEALGYLNDVRQRADLSPVGMMSKDDFREAVLKERRVELAFENHRWFDLKRTNTREELTSFLNAYGAAEKANPTVGRGGVPFNSFDYVFEPYEVFLPIPPDLIRLNNDIIQNDGY